MLYLSTYTARVENSKALFTTRLLQIYKQHSYKSCSVQNITSDTGTLHGTQSKLPAKYVNNNVALAASSLQHGVKTR